jgi:hypothetical protein
MNLPAARANVSSPRASQGEADPSCRRDDPLVARRCDEFDRLLRRKSAAGDETERSGGGDAAASLDGAAAGLAAPLASPPHAKGAGGAAPMSPAASHAGNVPGEPSATAVRATLEAGLLGLPAPVALAGGSADAGTSWSVTLHQPLGTALEFRASRSAGAAEPHATWTLTIGSTALDATGLARHLPRLSERLRARARNPTHVRIEADEEEPT